MLKRISLIKGVGTYAECEAKAAEFRKTGLIFGYNSYGKSTLGEVFRSLETGDVAEVAARRSIPGPVEQKIVLKFLEDGGNEVPVCLEGGAWRSKLPGGFTVHVFDSGFVARNLYSGLKAERGNREALSRFVLGEQGVAKATLITELRKKLATTKSNTRTLHRQLQSAGDVDAFVSMVVTETVEQLKADIEPLQVELGQLKQQLASLTQIKGRSLLTKIGSAEGMLDELRALNATFAVTSDTAHGPVRDRVIAHMREHMVGDRGANEWLRHGLAYLKTDKCPYCEQDLRNASDLIDAYRQYFNQELQALVSKVVQELSPWDDRLLTWGIYLHGNAVEKNATVLASYKELDQDEQFIQLRNRFAELGEQVKAAREKFGAAHIELRQVARAAIQSKRAAPYEAGIQLDLGEYAAACSNLNEAVSAFNQQLGEINGALEAFKARSDRSLLETEIAHVTGDIRAKELRVRRVESAVTCTTYSHGRLQEDKLEAQIKAAQAELNQEQSEYLAKFFERINYYFERLGSKLFSIGKEEELNNQGYQPVLSLVIKYNGVTIDPARMGAVFSESDRRALALSVFWAKVSILSDIERARAIVVLDDPVTSFDDNRISAAILQMRLEATSLRQMLVLTHYHAFAKRWLEVEAVDGMLSLHRLTRDAKTSGIAEGDASEFVHSEQQKLYQRLVDFIDRKTEEAIGTDLRIFLENEIRDRYRQQLAKLGLQNSGLADAINGLAGCGAIAADVAKQANLFREDLNGPHHVLAARTRDDWASMAHTMLDFIYTKL